MKDFIELIPQPVFIINSDLEIQPAISKKALKLFGNDIVGKNIYEILFKDLDSKSEAFGNHESNLSIIFGEEDLQFDLSLDYLVKKLSYISKDQETLQFKISYLPRWDENDSLIELIIYAEENTQLYEAHSEIKTIKKAEEVNHKIIKEISELEKDSLEEFLHTAIQTLKKDKELVFNSKIDPSSLDHLFRDIHTLKGNARLLKLSILAKTIHFKENEFEEIKKKHQQNGKIEEEDITLLLKGLGQIKIDVSKYAKQAFLVLKIEDKLFNENIFDIHRLTSKLDLKVNFLYRNIREGKEINQKVNGELVKDIYNFAKMLEIITLEVETHSLNDSIAKVVTYLDSLEDMTLLGPEDIRSKLGVKTQNYAAKMLDYFKDSFLNESLNLDPQIWSYIILDLFKITLPNNYWESSVQSGEIHTKFKKYDLALKLKSFCGSNQLFLLERVFTEISNKLRDVEESAETDHLIFQEVRRAWNYTSFIIYRDAKDHFSFHFCQEIYSLLNSSIRDHHLLEQKLKKYQMPHSIFSNVIKLFLKEKLSLELLFTSIQSFLKLPERDDCLNLFFEFENETTLEQFDKVLKLFGSSDNLRDVLKILKSEDKTNPWVVRALSMAMIHPSELQLSNYLVFTEIYRVFYKDFSKNFIAKKNQNIETLPIFVKNIENLKNIIGNKIAHISSNEVKEINDCLESFQDLPIAYHFSKLEEMVGTISRDLGKDAILIIENKEMLIPNHLVESLKDMFMHMIRNSLDHGIETPKERIDSGKSPLASIKIKGVKDEDNFYFYISDDGRGINVDRLKQKALEIKLHTQDELKKMSSNEITELLFSPQFSTKETITELSGRGVGMDVVKQIVTEQGGEISIDSNPGIGTTFSIKFSKSFQTLNSDKNDEDEAA